MGLNLKKIKTTLFHRGVTLIELLIVISILCILAMLTYPHYTTYIQQSHRAKAIVILTRTQLYIESLYSTRTEDTEKQRYKALLEQIIDYQTGHCLIDHICQIDRKKYQLSYAVSGSGMNIYTLHATPTLGSSQDKDPCGKLTLNAAGIGTAQKDHCW